MLLYQHPRLRRHAGDFGEKTLRRARESRGPVKSGSATAQIRVFEPTARRPGASSFLAAEAPANLVLSGRQRFSLVRSSSEKRVYDKRGRRLRERAMATHARARAVQAPDVCPVASAAT